MLHNKIDLAKSSFTVEQRRFLRDAKFPIFTLLRNLSYTNLSVQKTISSITNYLTIGLVGE
jgi:hypothetical protein